MNFVTKFESVKKEAATALKPLEEKVPLHSGETICNLEHSANEHSDQLTSMQANVAMLSAMVDTLSKKCEDLEARSRWNNIQLVNF